MEFLYRYIQRTGSFFERSLQVSLPASKKEQGHSEKGKINYTYLFDTATTYNNIQKREREYSHRLNSPVNWLLKTHFCFSYNFYESW